MFDPRTESGIKKLRQAKAWSRKQWNVFSEKRTRALRELVGFNYSEDGAPDRVPINYIELAKTIYVRHLAANPPAVNVLTKHAALKVMADDWEQVINQQIESEGVHAVLNRLVTDSLFGVAICKVFWERTRQVEVEGETFHVGEVRLKRIAHDDWVQDMSADSLEEARFMGHKFRVPLEEAQEDDRYDAQVRKSLKPTHKQKYNEEGQERADGLSGERYGHGDDNELEAHVELWELYLPKENLVATFAEDGDGLPLLVEEWKGPKGGPFALLSYDEVPDNPYPLSPAAVWMDLHELANTLYRKIAQQGERQKTVVGYREGADDDATRVVNASDGQAIAMEDPDNVKEFRFGGPDQVNLALLLGVKQDINRHYGNLDLLGGLSPQSDTATQDKLLSTAAMARLGKMQDMVYRYSQRVIEMFAYWTWADPWREYRFVKSLPGFSMVEVEGVNTPEQRQAVEFGRLNFEIEQHSMQPRSPQERLAFVTQTITQVLAPIMPMLLQQGLMIDGQELIALLSEYGNAPELLHILRFVDVPEGDGRGPIGEPMTQKPFATNRTYTRVNRPGSTRQGQEAVLANVLLGAKNQQSEMAAVGRPVG